MRPHKHRTGSRWCWQGRRVGSVMGGQPSDVYFCRTASPSCSCRIFARCCAQRLRRRRARTRLRSPVLSPHRRCPIASCGRSPPSPASHRSRPVPTRTTAFPGTSRLRRQQRAKWPRRTVSSQAKRQTSVTKPPAESLQSMRLFYIKSLSERGASKAQEGEALPESRKGGLNRPGHETPTGPTREHIADSTQGKQSACGRRRRNRHRCLCPSYISHTPANPKASCALIAGSARKRSMARAANLAGLESRVVVPCDGPPR
jgi:hypothetical protein